MRREISYSGAYMLIQQKAQDYGAEKNSVMHPLGDILIVGDTGTNNIMEISNGSTVFVRTTFVGDATIGDQFVGTPPLLGYNRVEVTGTGSVWNIGTVSDSRLEMGGYSPDNQLIITNGGRVNVSFIRFGTNLLLQSGEGRFNNILAVSGGNVFVTNAGSAATLNVVAGSNVMLSGTMTVDKFIATNGALSVVAFHGGTIATKGTMISNGSMTVVGNGASVATLHLMGGTHSFADGLQINTNATLMGTGTVVDDTTVLGTLSPGNSAGIIYLGNLTLEPNAVFAVEVNGTNVGAEYDQADIAGFANISNSLLALTLGYTPVKGDTFTILDNDASDPVLGEFAGLANLMEFQSGGSEFKIVYTGGTGNDIPLIVVPEPSSVTFLFATASLLLLRRRRSWRNGAVE